MTYAEWKAQDRVVATYRDRFGYPRIEQPDDDRVPRLESACIALACGGLAALVAWVAYL